MTRSSRHKSHKQSKHSSKDGKEHSESEKEDVKKIKDRNNGEGSVRVSRDSGSSDKRKLSKEPSSRDNGCTAEENVGLKRRKEKAGGRWSGGGDEVGVGAMTVIKVENTEVSRTDGDKSKPLVDSKRIDGDKSKPWADSKRIDGEKSKGLADSKSKSSRRHESGSEKKDANVGLLAEKEGTKSATRRFESKKKSEKDSGAKEVQQNENSKDKERGVERERKIIEDTKGQKGPTVDVEAARKQVEEQQGNRGRINTEYAIQDELRNPELEKELERRMRKRNDNSTEKYKYYDTAKDREDGRLSSRRERVKDGRYKDEKHKAGSSGDKHHEDRGANRHRDDKYREDAERDGRHRDVKYREDDDKDYRHKDNKYREDSEKDNRRKDDKYRDSGDRDKRQRSEKYREDCDRDKRQRDYKYCEDGDKNIRYRDDKYLEDCDRDSRRKGGKYDEDGDRDYRHWGDKYHDHMGRDDRHKDDRYVEDGHMDSKIREEKNWDSRHREGMRREDYDKDKRLQDGKYQDDQSSRDCRSGKSDIKHLRDESNAAAELHRRQSNNLDASPFFDDLSSRYKDDRGMKRTGDKEDHGEIRSRSSAKQQNNLGEKKSFGSVRVDLVGDRGRSNSCNTTLEITVNHSRRRNSPSSTSHVLKDHYRFPKYEESKSKDYIHEEERTRHTVFSTKEYGGVAGDTEKSLLSGSVDKTLKKDDIHLVEFSGERHPKEDAHTSPVCLVDKSPLSTSTDRRQLNRPGVRRNLDIDDSGKRSGGSRDAKSPSQVDKDNKSVSSPFSRMNQFSCNPRSLLPPPPVRKMGPDSPLVSRSFEDDNRSKPNNRHRRIGDPTMGRAQGSPWRGVSNSPSPVPNGFVPFQHGPPQVGFHPVMQQFPAPPMFGLRPPSMEMNQSGPPYHAPDGDIFSGHGRPHNCRNQVDEPIHGWDTSNAVFRDESHNYGRQNWDHNSRAINGGQVWETSSGALWKGHTSGASIELPSAPDRGGYSGHGQADEVWPGHSGLKSQNNEISSIALVESNDVDQSNDVEKNALEIPEAIPVEALNLSNLSREVDARLSQLYLSMLDISQDLTEPEIYSQYTNFMGMDSSTVSEEDSKFLLVEGSIGMATNVCNRSSNGSPFSTLNNSMLQKAMSLYKATREEDRAISGCKVPFFDVEYLASVVALDEGGAEGVQSNDKPGGDVVPECDQQILVVASALNKVKTEISPAIFADKMDESVLGDGQEKSQPAIAVQEKVKVELDRVSEQRGTHALLTEEKSSPPETVEKSSPPENGVKPDNNTILLGNVEEVNEASDSKGDCAVTNDVECGLSLFSDVSHEAVMPESVESESVNLCRIHQSPESTH